MNALDVQHLSFAYHDGTTALRDISFSVAEGEHVGLIGPNGAGKSTLLLHLNGILPERLDGASAVRVFGEALTARSLPSIRRDVGLVFQNPDDQLFCATVEEDVAFGPDQLGLDRHCVQQALATVGLAHLAARSPQHLSQGEKRRVCLAGVLACAPRVLLLDEPSSGLDPRARRDLKALLHALPITMLIASHDLEMIAELCRTAIIMDKGAVVASGAARDLLNNEPLMLAHGLERPHCLRHTHPHDA